METTSCPFFTQCFDSAAALLYQEKNLDEDGIFLIDFGGALRKKPVAFSRVLWETSGRRHLEMRIGIFGGSFDPPHVCHVLACLYVLETTDTEKILAIPCYEHAFGKGVASFEQRLEMCRLAFSPLGKRVEVSAIEGERKAVSYTIETVRELKSRYPSDQFRLIIGSDILKETDEWKDFDELKRLVEIITLPRVSAKQTRRASKEPFFFPDLSSTLIRQRLAEGKSVEGLLPRSVLDYIRENHLYGVK
jgi:nicotinate-nucleotide adenylyltransferase